MVDKIEMSLDDIIKTTNIGKRRPNARGGAGAATGRSASAGSRPRGGNQQNGGRAGGGRTQGGGVAKSRNSGGRPSNVTSPRGGGQRFARGDVNSAWKHDMFEGGKKVLRTSGALAGGQQAGSAKLLVSNLDYGVSESDIHELFADFGPLKNASVHYDRSGRSLGTADVVFERRADAVKAMKQYNGVPLDGRPMNIQLAISELPAPIAPPRPRPVGGNGGGRPQPQQKRRGPPAGGRAAGGGGGGAPRGGRQNGRTPNPSKTAEELDAELDAYVNDMKL